MLVIALLGGVTACVSPPPYVLAKGEFDRESDYFLRGELDRSEVIICYAKDGTTARTVSKMALDACAAHGKKAVFREQSYQECPLFTPMAAIYNCVDTVSRSGFNTFDR